MRLTHWLHPLRRAVTSTNYPALNPISIISLIPGFRQSPSPRNPPPPLQTAQPGGKKTVIVPNLSEQDATTLVDVLKDMGFAYRLEDAA